MKTFKPLLIYSPLIIALDHLTKYLIVQHIGLNDKIVVIPNFFDLVFVFNKGAAFGIFANLPDGSREILFYIISAIALAMLIHFYRKSPMGKHALRTPIAFILGGALGNMIDRFFRGAVVDFLSFHWYNKIADFRLLGAHFRIELTWPAFNVADIAISCGVVWLIWRMYRLEKAK